MGVDKTLKSSNQRLSILKYLNETLGDDGEGHFYIVTNTQQIDFESLRNTREAWYMVEFGPGVPKPKMNMTLFVTCCARDNDSEVQLDAMKDLMRDHLAPGTNFPLYDISTQAKIGGFYVGDCLEGVAVEQSGGGWNLTYTIVLQCGVVI